MIRVIFVIYFCVACLITGIQFLTEYLKTQDSILTELKQLEETVRGPVSTSLWQYDDKQLDVLIDGLVTMPIIEGVDIKDTQGNTIVYKRLYRLDSEPFSMFDTTADLSWTLNGKNIALGTMTLYSSSKVVLDRVWFGFVLIAITAIIKLSVLFGLFIWAFNRYLALPLKELMSQVDEVQLSHTLNKRITLSNFENNELNQLQEHMNTMLTRMEKDRQRLLNDEKTKREWLEKAVTERTAELQMLNEKLKDIAAKDSLTGVLNRGNFFETAQHLFLLSQRQQSPASFILMDLDHFKRINDTYGHFIGDHVLIHFMQTIQGLLRKSDLIGRVGGEEFALFLPNAGIDEAYEIANKIRQAIKASTVEIDGKKVTYTVSQGIEAIGPEDHSIVQLYKRADVKLYQAKDKGRDCVEI
ncbi:diguanylate cyclase [Nitrincola iocasae]|uniref:diguanylate cyclase n=2 Tax=Nitrincola iocasae TaxID=2614693 RepID=A0A5J6LIW0_9GAMM|nr:diguanylate cyclase [Nitrincola iocasae]